MAERLTWQRGTENQNSASAATSGSNSAAAGSSSGTADKSSVGFLYNKQELDREAYLTGKKVDKNFTAHLENDKNAFDASLDPHKDNSKREYDLGRKLRDDPLALVKEKEHERFKKLQANPQKMARMKKLMMTYLGDNKESDGDSSDDDSSRKRKQSKDSKPSRDRRRSRSRDRKRNRRSRSRSKESRNRRSRSKSPKPKKPEYKEGYGLIVSEATKKRNSERKDEKYESQFAKFKTNEPVGYTRKEKHGFTKKLTAEEKAERLAKMQGNAASHDVSRKQRVVKGRKEDEEEEKSIKREDHSYFRKMKMAATDKSLEERVKARSSANQKTSAALDKNWTKR